MIRVQVSLQEMADIAQGRGMHPDEINAVCDKFDELHRAVQLILAIQDNPQMQSHPIDLDPKALEQLRAAVKLSVETPNQGA